MKDVPLPEIDGVRRFFEGKQFPKEKIMVAGKPFEYYVLPQSLNPDLPDFAFRATHMGENKNITGIFGVSDSVPQKLRPYWAMHEIIEFTHFGFDKKWRCANAERIVLEEIPAELKKEFVDRRIVFFTNLLAYFKKDIDEGKENYTIDDLKEIKGSLSYLQCVKKIL